MNLNQIKNIIFDLGGVIIDIDPAQSYQALQALADVQNESSDWDPEKVSLFLDYEQGLITAQQFRDGIRELTKKKDLSDTMIDRAWNAMLLKIPLERIELLQKLKEKYRLFVLSNTNDIHVLAFNAIVQQVSGKEDLAAFFDKVYYSHELRMRKPQPAIYSHVLKENDLKPSETLFLDDRYDNIMAAESLGIQTFHVAPGQEIVSFFQHL